MSPPINIGHTVAFLSCSVINPVSREQRHSLHSCCANVLLHMRSRMAGTSFGLAAKFGCNSCVALSMSSAVMVMSVSCVCCMSSAKKSIAQ